MTSHNLSEVASIPIVVDLDGTLIKTDLLLESANQFLIKQPSSFLRLIFWALGKRSALKESLARRVHIDCQSLPYNEELVCWLQEQKSVGRTLILATASHHSLAKAVADHLGLFSDVIATTGDRNLKAAAKRDELVERFGHHQFDYIGDSRADMAVWPAARQAMLVSRSADFIKSAQKVADVKKIFDPERRSFFSSLLKAIRIHQWVKNLLIFVPLLAAHQFNHPDSIFLEMVAFLVFGLIASSVYVLNDLVDIENDRHHSTKKSRPFASGDLSLLFAWILWPCLAIVGFGLAALFLPLHFIATLAVYLFLTLAYTFRLKQIAIVDVLVLAGLYTLRIIAGAAAISVPLSFWLLTFSMFIFLSLALVKRFSELLAAKQSGHAGLVRGRGYIPEDLGVVSSMGIASGYISVLVLALYIQDSYTSVLYKHPQLIWLACPLMLFWISRVWLITHRGDMHSDPIVFAVRDKASLGLAFCFGLIFLLAMI
jgi:4-hydroxybenzoate polyprenyltransferase/phosphoglycolate phosphatase-like HAD superfamily hydrolase